MTDSAYQVTSSPTDHRRQALDWLADFGDDLYSYARARVPDQASAEDLVQETLLTALATYEQFRHEAAVGTWLVGILRRKVVDYYRQRTRDRQTNSELQTQAQHAVDTGCRHPMVGKWQHRPDKQFESQEFRQVFDDCLAKLSPSLGEAFVLRVVDELETDEVCSVLGITPTNLMVRLHRARLALRECLDKNWFRETR